MENRFVLNDEELKVRKRWLIIFLCKIGFSLICFGVIANFLGEINSREIIKFQLLLVHFSLIYFFSYLRFGTKYLTLIFVVTLMSFPRTIRGFFEGLNGVIMQKEILPFWMLDILDITLGVLLCIYSFKIWQINKAINLYKKFPNEVKEIASLLQGSSGLEDLRATFSNEIRKRPQLERIITREYKIALVGRFKGA